MPVDEADSLRWQLVAALSFSTKDDTAEFVIDAFPDCIFDELNISSFLSERILDAIGRIADSVIINGVLRSFGNMTPNETLNLVRKFRK
ncbi:hypothetical protein AAVH_38111, partial [Aphelenchoides avenae]